MHVHAEMSLEERLAHDATPHFHFGRHAQCHGSAKSTHCHGDGHVHHHHESGHGHSHLMHGHGDAHPLDTQSCPIQCPIDDHSSDAIFLVEIDAALPSNGYSPVPRFENADSGWPPFGACYHTSSQRLSNELEFERPPDKVLDGSTIYLIYRQLRI